METENQTRGYSDNPRENEGLKQGNGQENGKDRVCEYTAKKHLITFRCQRKGTRQRQTVLDFWPGWVTNKHQLRKQIKVRRGLEVKAISSV